MKSCLLLPGMVILLLLALGVMPVQAETPEELARQASIDLVGIDLTEPKPAYQMTAQDYLSRGNYYSSGCKKLSTQYNERLKTWAKNKAQRIKSGGPVIPDLQKYLNFLKSLENPSQEQRQWILDHDSFGTDDPEAISLYKNMLEWCIKARENYNTAASMAAKDDYKQQAEIYEGAAGVYDTMGNKKAAEDARDEAAFARGRQRLASGSDCLIVTATFGSPMASEVQLVREFRDSTIRQDYLGSRYVTALNALYYSFSPSVARAIEENPSVKPVMRVVLAPLLAIVLLSKEVYALLSFSPGIATFVFIIIGGALVGLAYVLPVMVPILWIAMRRNWQIPSMSTLKPVIYLWAGLIIALVIGDILKIDIVAILSSGLLFICTMLLTAGAVSLFLSGHFGIRRPVEDE